MKGINRDSRKQTRTGLYHQWRSIFRWECGARTSCDHWKGCSNRQSRSDSERHCSLLRFLHWRKLSDRASSYHSREQPHWFPRQHRYAVGHSGIILMWCLQMTRLRLRNISQAWKYIPLQWSRPGRSLCREIRNRCRITGSGGRYRHQKCLHKPEWME